jgi:hypothetical protein
LGLAVLENQVLLKVLVLLAIVLFLTPFQLSAVAVVLVLLVELLLV